MTSIPAAPRTFHAQSWLAQASLLVMMGFAWWLVAAGSGNDLVWINLTIAATIAGFLALGWLRPSRVDITAPQLMLLLGAFGMVAGLAGDARAGGFARLASACLAAPGDFGTTLRLHWQQLPMMHLGMIVAGLATVPLLRGLRKGCRRQFCARLVQNLVCSAWMVAGMTGGTLFFVGIAAWAGGRSPAAMLGGMFAGMVWGMVASVSLYRLWFLITEGPRGATRS